jgi:purine nucleosidase
MALTTIIGASLIISGLYGKGKVAKKKKVYFDMDGNCDDFVAFLLLLNLPNVELVGVSIVPADCEVAPAKEFVSKLIYKRGLKVPITDSNVKPVNDFPQEWKSLTLKATYLPTLLKIDYSKKNELNTDGPESMYSTLKKIYDKSKEKTTLLITGPPSTLTEAMKKHPDIKNYIEEVFWMGGAIDVDGNVMGVKYSEYNAYWDPTATKEFIESGLQIKVLSLDSTNSVPVNKEMLTKLAKYNRFDGINLTNELFAIAFWALDDGTSDYYAWDCLAAMALGYDDLIEFKEAEVKVITTKGDQEGRIAKEKGTKHFIKYGQKLNEKSLQYFYDAFIKTLKYNL